MDDPVRVGEPESTQHLGYDREAAALRERAGRFDELVEALALHQLHDQKRHAVVVTEIPDRDDVRVEPPSGGPRFPPEALEQLLASAAGDQFGTHYLDCDQAIDCRVVGAIDFAHRPGTEQCFDAIAADRPDSIHLSGLKLSWPAEPKFSFALPACSSHSAGCAASD